MMWGRFHEQCSWPCSETPAGPHSCAFGKRAGCWVLWKVVGRKKYLECFGANTGWSRAEVRAAQGSACGVRRQARARPRAPEGRVAVGGEQDGQVPATPPLWGWPLRGRARRSSCMAERGGVPCGCFCPSRCDAVHPLRSCAPGRGHLCASRLAEKARQRRGDSKELPLRRLSGARCLGGCLWRAQSQGL